MKTVISIPDDVFADAERLASRLKMTRSALYSCAIQEFVFRHADDRISEALNRVVAVTEETADGFGSESACRLLTRIAD